MISRFDDAFTFVNRAIVGGLLLAMAVLVFSNVVLRYAVGTSLTWVEELTRYMMIWVAWLAIGLGMRQGAHIAIDTLQQALPDYWSRLLRLVILVLVAAFFAAVAWYGWQYSQFAWRQHSAVLRLPLGAVYLAIPLGSLLMLVHLGFASKEFLAERQSTAEFGIL